MLVVMAPAVLPLPLSARTAVAVAACILAAAYTYAFARRAPPGEQRAALCAPVVLAALAATPALVDYDAEPLLITPVAGILSLLAFKVCCCCVLVVCVREGVGVVT